MKNRSCTPPPLKIIKNDKCLFKNYCISASLFIVIISLIKNFIFIANLIPLYTFILIISVNTFVQFRLPP